MWRWYTWGCTFRHNVLLFLHVVFELKAVKGWLYVMPSSHSLLISFFCSWILLLSPATDETPGDVLPAFCGGNLPLQLLPETQRYNILLTSASTRDHSLAVACNGGVSGCVRTYVCRHVCTHLGAYVNVCVDGWVCSILYVYVYACMCVHVWVWVCGWECVSGWVFIMCR